MAQPVIVEAARKGGDIERPMDGEDPGAAAPEVVSRWLRAYAEIESLETGLLDLLAAVQAGGGMSIMRRSGRELDLDRMRRCCRGARPRESFGITLPRRWCR